jgi:pimeloyl-ACP methyl ester carboxylesterase
MPMTAIQSAGDVFDHPEISRFLFNPRPEWGASGDQSGFEALSIDVADAVRVGARFYPAHQQAPNLLFFHGNGEIVEDYDDIARLYMRMNINFFPVDYRGYGRSTGRPTVSTMLADAHAVFGFFCDYLERSGFSGPRVVMGRSLGSASALELAGSNGTFIDGLVIESGFAYVLPLLRLIGIDVDRLGLSEDQGFSNAEKIRRYTGPTLIIHAEYDHIIPFSDGQALFEHSPAADKTFLKIPDANHNDILAHGLQPYMETVKSLLERIIAARQ